MPSLKWHDVVPNRREWVHLLIGAILGTLFGGAIGWVIADRFQRETNERILQSYDELIAQQFITRMSLQCPPKDSWEDQARVMQFKEAMRKIRARMFIRDGFGGAPSITKDCKIGVNWSASFSETLNAR